MKDIPDKITETIYAHLCVDPEDYQFGKIDVCKYKKHEWDNGLKHILLGEKEVTILTKIPDDFGDISVKAVRVLEKKKKELQAQYQLHLSKLQNQIDNLQAIEFKG